MRLRATAAALVSAVLVAGCGGGSDSQQEKADPASREFEQCLHVAPGDPDQEAACREEFHR